MRLVASSYRIAYWRRLVTALEGVGIKPTYADQYGIDVSPEHYEQAKQILARTREKGTKHNA